MYLIEPDIQYKPSSIALLDLSVDLLAEVFRLELCDRIRMQQYTHTKNLCRMIWQWRKVWAGVSLILERPNQSSKVTWLRNFELSSAAVTSPNKIVR